MTRSSKRYLSLLFTFALCILVIAPISSATTNPTKGIQAAYCFLDDNDNGIQDSNEPSVDLKVIL